MIVHIQCIVFDLSCAGAPPTGALAQAITKKWGSMDKFIETFNTAAAGVQGMQLFAFFFPHTLGSTLGTCMHLRRRCGSLEAQQMFACSRSHSRAFYFRLWMGMAGCEEGQPGP